MSDDSLRIVVIGPPWFEIPPRAYGGIEWLCYWLVEGLITRGHDVTLIAAGQNHTQAQFIRTYDEAPSLRLGEPLPELIHAAAQRGRSTSSSSTSSTITRSRDRCPRAHAPSPPL